MWIDHKNSLVCIQNAKSTLSCFSYHKILHICLCFNNSGGGGRAGVIQGGITQIHGKAPGLSASGMSPYARDTPDLKARRGFSSHSSPPTRQAGTAGFLLFDLWLSPLLYFWSFPGIFLLLHPHFRHTISFPSSPKFISSLFPVCFSLFLLFNLSLLGAPPQLLQTLLIASVCRMSVAGHHLGTI